MKKNKSSWSLRVCVKFMKQVSHSQEPIGKAHTEETMQHLQMKEAFEEDL